LEDALKQASAFRRRLIVTETLFSMDGDEAPLNEIADLAQKYDAMLMVDEAHATGVYGRNGAGIVSKLGLGEHVLVQMGTLGKALGGFGAYVAGSVALREFIINRCRSFVFTTSLPPAVMAMGIAALDLLNKEPERRVTLRSNCARLNSGLKKLGYSIADTQSQIIPLMVGDADECMRLSEELFSRGVFAQGIRPPTVPPGTSRLRITVMATHSGEHLKRALGVFGEVVNGPQAENRKQKIENRE
jgi:7-keto-8-aminopelargonate synthetase-like enzyme